MSCGEPILMRKKQLDTSRWMAQVFYNKHKSSWILHFEIFQTTGRDGYILNMSSKADGTSPLFKMSTSPSDKPSYTEKKFKYFSDG